MRSYSSTCSTSASFWSASRVRFQVGSDNAWPSGRAIVRDPAVFLMDEPLSNLNAKLRVQTRAELIRLHERLQATVIYVTHDQMEAMTMGSRIAVLRDGLLQQLGSP